MDSILLRRSEDNSSSLAPGGGGVGSTGGNIPAWKLPLTSSLIGNNKRSQDDKRNPSEENAIIPKKVSSISPELAEDEATAQLIQILLPCIICNRTFSPEALERHAKICTTVNIKDPRKQNRGTFDSSEQRKKDTPVADFIPPPPVDENGEFIRLGSRRYRDSFSRGSRGRSSLGKLSTTGSVTGTTTPTTTQPNNSSLIPTWRRGVSSSPARPSTITTTNNNNNTSIIHSTKENNKSGIEPYEDNSEFGSEESQDANSTSGGSTVPSYARALSPSEDCPYCGRNFNLKAYDRHFKFCQELYMRKQYEHQPTPKEKEEAMERQEIRTKYKPLKSSSSCTSLRSMSPGKDFSSMMAMKLYGFMNKTFNRNNYNFKKSNESLSNSCYGDYTRGMRRPSPGPTPTIIPPSKPMTYQRSNTTMSFNSNSKVSPVMRLNTTSNIPKRTKSNENLNVNLANVQSSGYGQQYTSNNSNNSFTRNSKTRSSLHKNFFRNSSKRVEPEGTENTSSSGSPGSLIITPMSFYSRGKNYASSLMQSSLYPHQHHPSHDEKQPERQHHPLQNNNLITNNTILMNRNNSHNNENRSTPSDMEMEDHHQRKGILLSADPNYDPYEKAARQFEELLKSQPARSNNNNKQSSRSQTRKVGLDRAFRSVIPGGGGGGGGVGGSCEDENEGRCQSNSNEAKTGGGKDSSKNNARTTNDDGNSFVFNPADDSYWDQILLKSNTKCSPSSLSQEGQDDSHAISGGSGSGSASASDTDNSKSRAVSNISSVDSAFSRSDGADLEFEALETLMSLGEVPRANSLQSGAGTGGGGTGTGSGTGQNSNNNNNNNRAGSLLPSVIPTSKSSSLMSSFPSRSHGHEVHPPAISSSASSHFQQTPSSVNGSGSRNRMTPTLPSLPNSQNQNQNHKNTNQEEQQVSNWLHNGRDNIESRDNQVISNNPVIASGNNNSNGLTSGRNNSNSGGGGGMLAKFCHECGTPYPNTTAKFCPECGERRVMK